jgi:Fe2+ transport system protein FeoA
MTNAFELLPLHLLPAGALGRIAQLVGDRDQVHRLEELGLRRGVVIQMVNGGSPCIVHLEGARMCFRSSELLGVLVTREEAA